MALTDHPSALFLRALGKKIVKPRAVICISAHWEAVYPKLTGGDTPEIIFDFSGPPELLRKKYRPPGSTHVARQARDALDAAGFDARVDNHRGLDHGTWIPMMLMYSAGDVPVVQLSIQTEQDLEYHYKMGEALRPLRRQGILILASGGAVHNLDEVHEYAIDDPPPEYVAAFDRELEQAIVSGDTGTLINYDQQMPHPERCHPYPAEHFLPLFVAMGSADNPAGKKLHGSFMFGTLSMAAYGWD